MLHCIGSPSEIVFSFERSKCRKRSERHLFWARSFFGHFCALTNIAVYKHPLVCLTHLVWDILSVWNKNYFGMDGRQMLFWTKNFSDSPHHKSKAHHLYSGILFLLQVGNLPIHILMYYCSPHVFLCQQFISQSTLPDIGIIPYFLSMSVPLYYYWNITKNILSNSYMIMLFSSPWTWNCVLISPLNVRGPKTCNCAQLCHK